MVYYTLCGKLPEGHHDSPFVQIIGLVEHALLFVGNTHANVAVCS